MKKFIIGAAAAATMLLFALPAMATGQMVIDRGLPNTNLNNSAGADRSNVSWSNGNDYVSGDDFTIGTAGQKWIVTGIRTWTPAMSVLGDEYSDMSLYFGNGSIHKIKYGTLSRGSSINNNTDIVYSTASYLSSPPVSYYEGGRGKQYTIWQTDFNNLHLVVNGGKKYYFAVDATPTDSNDYWFNHASNKDRSGSQQQGSDNRWLAWDKNNLDTTPFVCDSMGEMRNICDGGWDKSSDINVQVFAVQVRQSKDDCKDYKWKDLVSDEGNHFKNQGECVSYNQSNNHTGKR